MLPQSGQGLMGQLASAPHAVSLGGWIWGSRMAHSQGRHIGTGHTARAKGSEHQLLSMWASPLHGLLWPPHSTVAGFQQQASKETGSGSCPFLKAWAQMWAIFICQTVTRPGSKGGKTSHLSRGGE